jgi:predicted nuclease of predicted toxin-antitoxin system
MKLVVGMCLPPGLVDALVRSGHQAVHWSVVGDATAADAAILEWAREQGHVVVTHDLDFGDLLFSSRGSSPSVIIIRERDTSTEVLSGPLLRVLGQFEQELHQGALIAMSGYMARVRPLPLV